MTTDQEKQTTPEAPVPAPAPAELKSPVQSPRPPRSSPPLPKYLGSVRDGKFWCHCNPPGQCNCRRAMRETKNKGRLFWACPAREGSCPFFLWDDEAAEAREWLVKYGPPEPPKTPKKDEVPNDETPWTIASKVKRKPVSREISDENANGGPSERRVSDSFVFVDADADVDSDEVGDGSPSRRAAKRARLSKGGKQSFTDRLRAVALPPTPETMEKGKGRAVDYAQIVSPTSSPSKGRGKERAVEVMDITSPTPSPSNRKRKGKTVDVSSPISSSSKNTPTPSPSNRKGKGKAVDVSSPVSSSSYHTPTPSPEQAGDLTAAVIAVIRSDKATLQESTIERIRLLINLELGAHEARVSTYEETIRRLMIELDAVTTDFPRADDPIELSD